MYCTLILSPLSNHWYTRHSHFMFIYHNSHILLHVYWHTDTLTYYTLSLLHGYATLLFHVLVSPSHGHSNTLNTICHVITITLDTVISCCSIYMSHYYIDIEIHNTIIACSWATDTLIHYYTGYRYMDTLCTVTSCSYTTII